MRFKKGMLLTALTVLSATHIPAIADQGIAFDSGAGATATANLDFRIVIPEFVFFRVGTATTGTVDLVEFDLGGITGFPGDSTPVAATGGSGDGTDGSLTVRLVSNTASLITITSTAPAGLTNGAAGTISYDDITASDGGIIAVPNLQNGISTSTVTPAGITNLTDAWAYSYDNTSTPEPGAYGGAGGTNGGRVVYTAAIP